MFMENDFENLFPYEGHVKNLTDIFNEKKKPLEEEEKILEENQKLEEKEKIHKEKIHKEIKKLEEDRELLCENYRVVIEQLPIFKMFQEYQGILLGLARTSKEVRRERFDFNPFVRALYLMKKNGKYKNYGLSNKFINEYFKEEDKEERNFYKFFGLENEYDEDKNLLLVQATNWYKLAYHYTRKEEAIFVKKKYKYSVGWELRKDDSDNFFKKIDMFIRQFASGVFLYDSKRKCWRHKNGDTEYRLIGEEIKEGIKEIEKKGYYSLFVHFLFTDGVRAREQVSLYTSIPEKVRLEVKPGVKRKVKSESDWWTKGILYDTYRRKVEEWNVRYGEIIHGLPEPFCDISMF
jgi:hypothetical protein